MTDSIFFAQMKLFHAKIIFQTGVKSLDQFEQKAYNDCGLS